MVILAGPLNESNVFIIIIIIIIMSAAFGAASESKKKKRLRHAKAEYCHMQLLG